MPASRQMTVTLPEDLAEKLDAKVARGEYASESDAICDGVRTLVDRDEAIERWLLAEVVPEIDAVRADPSLEVSAEEVRATLDADYRERARQRG